MKKGATLSIVWSPRSSEEKRNLYIAVRFGQGSKRYYSLGGKLMLSKAQFDNKSGKAYNLALDEVNAILQKAKKIVAELGDDFTFDDFKKTFDDTAWGKKKKGVGAKNMLVKEILEDYLKVHGLSRSTKNQYITASNWAHRFKINAKLKDLLDDEFYPNIKEFIRIESEQKRGKITKDVSISAVFASYRVFLNFAVKKKYIVFDEKPHITITTSESAKRDLKEAEFVKLVNYTPENSQEQLGYDMLWLSYYLDGMNLADMFRLKNRSVFDGQIQFERWKTKSRVKTAKVLEPLLNKESIEILNRQGVVDPNNPNEYVLNFFKGISDLDHVAQDKKKSNVNKQINEGLAAICVKLKITPKITFYSARHTFSTQMINDKVDVGIICKLLGHSDISVTMNYVNRLYSGVRAEVSESKNTRVEEARKLGAKFLEMDEGNEI